jgi:hypothetical protein
MAALRFPVLADLDARKLTWCKDRMTVGRMYQVHLHEIVKEVVASGLRCES